MDFSKQIEQITKAAKYYEEKGEDQLIKDIFQSVTKQKESGTLTNEQLKTFASTVSVILSKDQQARLNALIDKLIND
ncbi:MAG: hypothetical protein RR248_05930 [Clostridia bacterium]